MKKRIAIEYKETYNTTGKEIEEGAWCILSGGSRHYWVNGKYHRIGGPAVIYHDGRYGWNIRGYSFYSNKSYQAAAKLSDEEMLILVIKYGNISL